jgi:hypothetical protein
MAKIRKVTIGGMPSEPGDMGAGFYDGPVPPAGMYTGNVKRLALKTNKNGDFMVAGLVEINEKAGTAKAKFNEYGIWFNQNVTEQGAPYLSNFLKAIGCSYKAFIADGGVTVDDSEPPLIMKIGAKKITEDIMVSVATKADIYNGNEKLSVTRFIVKAEADDEDEVVEEEADEDEVEEDESDEDESDEDADEDEDEAEDEAEDEDGEQYTQAELMAMTIGALREMLAEQGWTAADWKGMSKAQLVTELAPGEDEPPF